MAAIRFVGTALVVLLLALGGGLAQAQDGLQRFEKEIKPQLEFKSFKYDKAHALGDKGFVLEGVTAVLPASDATNGKEATVKVEKVTVEEIDFNRLSGSKNDLPLFAKLKIEGMSGDDDLSGTMQGFGIPKVPVDMVFDYQLDPKAQVLTLNKLELSLRGQATLTLALVLEGVSDKADEATAGAKDNSRLRNASLTFDDAGLLVQLLPAIAKQQGSAPEMMVAMVVAPLGDFAKGQGAETIKALDALASFAGDWQKPKGPIKISITPAKSASFADLAKFGEPDALSDIFGLKVEYAGATAGAAK